MNELEIFENEKFGKLRTVEINGNRGLLEGSKLESAKKFKRWITHKERTQC